MGLNGAWRRALKVAVTLTALCGLAGSAAAKPAAPVSVADEIAELKRRIEELETRQLQTDSAQAAPDAMSGSAGPLRVRHPSLRGPFRLVRRRGLANLRRRNLSVFQPPAN